MLLRNDDLATNEVLMPRPLMPALCKKSRDIVVNMLLLAEGLIIG